nr:stage II sporulation protein D [Fictibacillus macauensis]
MKNKKPLVVIITLFIVSFVLIPTFLVLPYSSASSSSSKVELVKTLKGMKKKVVHESAPTSNLSIPVFRSTEKKIEKVKMEEYVKGVVASEMPAQFEMEALKAQALSARTYVAKALERHTTSLPKGALVTDSTSDQVYKNEQELKALWKGTYKEKMKRITEAVQATEGKIVTYDGKPITASFFSTSNGYTEDSADYWGDKLPYLQSVSSPWDRSAEKFTAKVDLPLKEVERKLGVSLREEGAVGTITKRTKGKRIAKIVIDHHEFSGKEIREKLALRSTDFTLMKRGDIVTVITKGFGHGVGMSQYGANGMAADGKSYKEIVKHYYKGVTIATYKPNE